MAAQQGRGQGRADSKPHCLNTSHGHHHAPATIRVLAHARQQGLRQIPGKVEQQAGYDPDIRAQQYSSAKARENIKAPWYNEWDRFTQAQVQNALLRRVKPFEALQASAKKAQELKKAS